jgi:hypothetical protein
MAGPALLYTVTGLPVISTHAQGSGRNQPVGIVTVARAQITPAVRGFMQLTAIDSTHSVRSMRLPRPLQKYHFDF